MGGCEMDLIKNLIGGVVWIHLVQDRDKWRTVVYTVMNGRVSQKVRN
jgi:hypothetical protein